MPARCAMHRLTPASGSIECYIRLLHPPAPFTVCSSRAAPLSHLPQARRSGDRSRFSVLQRAMPSFRPRKLVQREVRHQRTCFRRIDVRESRTRHERFVGTATGLRRGRQRVSRDPASAAASPAAHMRKPRLSLLFATSLGLGYIPMAPGTFGSLAGIVVALIPFRILAAIQMPVQSLAMGRFPSIDPLLFVQCLVAVAVALLGVWTSSRAARYWQQKDPQRVVIDEVSGQHLTLVLGSILPIWWRPAAESWAPRSLGFITYQSALNWKYLLLGLILFRAFDIWKPFPVRRAESLRSGWGIMADDWLAAIYASLGLWFARALGL
jgi:phosphatidylglycerophosphatase A